MKYLVILTSLVLIGCGNSKFKLHDHTDNTEKGPETCTVASTKDGVTITCPDGTQQTINHGQDGSNGTDGQDGQDGSDGVDGQNFVSEIIDPCGDHPGYHDEVILKLYNGQYLAWYKNLGFSILHTNTLYVTTDHQKCRFKINSNGQYQEL